MPGLILIMLRELGVVERFNIIPDLCSLDSLLSEFPVSKVIAAGEVALVLRLALLLMWDGEEGLSNVILPLDLLVCQTSACDTEEACSANLAFLLVDDLSSVITSSTYSFTQFLSKLLLGPRLLKRGQIKNLDFCPRQVVRCFGRPLPLGQRQLLCWFDCNWHYARLSQWLLGAQCRERKRPLTSEEGVL